MKQGLAIVLLVATGAGAAAQSTSLPVRISKTTLSDTNFMRSLYCAVLDTNTGYAYFSTAGGTNVDPGRIMKVDVSGVTPVEVASTLVASGDFNLNAACMDSSAGYAYFGVLAANPGRVLKVALGAGTNAPQVVADLTLDIGESPVQCLLGDTANGYGYLGCGGGTGIVVKIALGAGTNAPTRLGALGLPAGENRLRRGVIDPGNGYAYLAPASTAGLYLVKVALGGGTNLPTRVGAVSLPVEERTIGAIVLDSVNGNLYGGTYLASTDTARIVKIACGAGTNPPAYLGSISMLSGERELSSGVCDPAAGYALFGCDHTHPARVYKIAMTPGTDLPVRVGSLVLSAGISNYPVADGGNISAANPVYYGELYLQSAVIDPSRGLAWFGTDTRPGQVVKVAGAADVLGYDDWRIVKFSSNDLDNAAVSGATADPDGDNQPNLLEYALTSEPLTNDAVSTLVPAEGGFTYTRRARLFDTACVSETTTSLVSTAWTTNGAVEQAVATNGEAVTILTTFAGTDDVSSLRVRVTHP